MGEKIPPVSIARFEKYLKSVGCIFKRQRGSHRVWWKEGCVRPVIIPAHNKEIDGFHIATNLRTLGISTENYLEAMDHV